MDFAPIHRSKVVDQVAESIREAIVGGSLKAGDSLPAERSLAERFGVNRSSVREAIHRLEAWGLVKTRHGGGTRVTDFLSTAGLQLLPYLLAPAGKLDPKLLLDLMELRVVLMSWTAGQAARNANEDQKAELGALLQMLEEAQDGSRIQELDYDFFEILVGMTANKVLLLLSNAIRQVYMQNRLLFSPLYEDQSFDRAPHRAVLTAIEGGDETAARMAMEDYAGSALRQLGAA